MRLFHHGTYLFSLNFLQNLEVQANLRWRQSGGSGCHLLRFTTTYYLCNLLIIM
nr:MAG TPA: hypothetical protein [Caudoviricetes sp.]